MQNRKYHTKLVEFLSQYDFTEFLTLTENYDKDFSVYTKAGQSIARKDLFWSKVKIFFRRLSIRVYGTKQNRHKRIKHATFFENKTKHGDPTHIHCHSIIIMESEFRERFMKYARSEWIKLNKTSCTTPWNGDMLSYGFKLKVIYDTHGICNYITKHYDHSDFVPVIELQDKK